jgi:hypothetical protein
MADPKWRAINLKAWEVRAFLAERKTQIRRPVKPRPDKEACGVPYMADDDTEERHFDYSLIPCPFGRVGDRLWGREAWQSQFAHPDSTRGNTILFTHLADGGCGGPLGWRSSSSMPRLASRLSLKVVDVRVERANDVTVDDVKAMGCIGSPLGDQADYMLFHELWDCDYGDGAWERNEWVWAADVKII